MTPVRIAIFLLALASLCIAQQAAPAEVPVENEPHHHLVFENEYVRVFKVEVAPHEATLVHRHKRDYVVVTIGDAEVTNAVVGKEPKRWNFKDGDVTFLEATGEKSFAHKAVNEGGEPFRNYTIELKQPLGKTSEICKAALRCTENWIVWSGGLAAGGEGILPSQSLWIPVHGASLVISGGTANPSPLEAEFGASKWLEDPPCCRLLNWSQKSAAQFVIIQTRHFRLQKEM